MVGVEIIVEIVDRYYVLSEGASEEEADRKKLVVIDRERREKR
jgi:hypothetical protein